MAKSSAIINPFGDVTLDDNKKLLSLNGNLTDIKKMRRYMRVGI
jgi:hypothetical protein